MAESGRFSIIPARAFDDTRLSSAPLKLLGLLGTYQNKRSGWCWPSQETLAKRSGQTTRAIRKSLSTLREHGYIEIQSIGTNRNSGNRYKILHDIDLPEQFDRMAEKSPEQVIGTFEPPPERQVPMRPERQVPMHKELTQDSTQEKKKPYAAGAAEYAFEGRVIRLTTKDFLRWRRAYPAVPDLRAELQSLDDYYTHNLDDRSKWFCRASTALKKANTRALAAARANGNGAVKRKRRNILDEMSAAESSDLDQSNPEPGATDDQYRRLI